MTHRGNKYSNRLKSRTSVSDNGFFVPLDGILAGLMTPCRLRGALFFQPNIMKGKDMRNKGQEQCSDLMQVDVDANLAEQRYQDYAVSRFEQIYKENRIKCGLEVV